MLRPGADVISGPSTPAIHCPEPHLENLRRGLYCIQRCWHREAGIEDRGTLSAFGPVLADVDQGSGHSWSPAGAQPNGSQKGGKSHEDPELAIGPEGRGQLGVPGREKGSDRAADHCRHAMRHRARALGAC